MVTEPLAARTCRGSISGYSFIMNHFVKSGSRLFLFVSWVFLGSLFADSANLDDLFASNYVIHDDEDVASDLSQTAPASSQPSDHSGAQQSGSHPDQAVRVIVDQDSPSLPADRDASTLVGETPVVEPEVVAYETTLAAEPLHIKLRTLLI